MVAKIDEKLPAPTLSTGCPPLKFKPFLDTVLLEPIPRGQTAGGVIIPEKADMGPQLARVVAVGPGWPTDDGCERMPMEVDVGDLVYCTFSAQPHQIKLDGKTYVIVRMRDMIGKVT